MGLFRVKYNRSAMGDLFGTKYANKSKKAHYFQLYSVMQHAACVYMIWLCCGATLNPLNGRIMQKHGIISELFSTSPQSVSAFYVIINFTFLTRLVNDNGHHRQRPCLMEYAFEKETSSYLHGLLFAAKILYHI